MSIKLELQKKGFDSADLDDVVHEAASRLASNANNGGMESQLEFLMVTCGWSEHDIRTTLKGQTAEDEPGMGGP